MVLAALASLGYVSWGLARESSLEAIRRAIAAQQWGDVEAGLRRWLRGHPRDDNAWELLGGVLFDRGRMLEALEALRRVREGDSGWVHAQTLIGEIAIRQRHLAEAERIFRRAAERDRRAVEPLERLASLLVLERRTAEARSVLRRLFQVSREPRHLADSILVAQLESEVRDLSPEIEAFLRQTPDDPWLRRVWGLFLMSRGRSAEARPHLEAAAMAFEDDPLGRFALAECRMAMGISPGDLSILGTPPSRAVDAARWWVLRSRLAEAWGRDDEALESARKAVTADPRNAEAQYRLGQAMIRRGDRQGARVHLDRAEAHGAQEDRLRLELRRLPRERFEGDSLLRIGRLCQEAEMTAEARDWFELALQRDPRHRPSRFDPGHLAPTDEGPAVALSRPVLIASAPPRPPDRSPQMAAQPDSGPRLEEIAEQSGVRFQYESGATPDLFIGDTMGGGVALFDYDDDGWLDLYFVNGCPLPFDRQSPPRPNMLYRNRGDGTFEEVTERAGVAGRGYGMGCAVGDFDNDGHDDLFVTGLSQTVLYRNRGDGTFEDVTNRAGVSSSRWTTAAGFADLDGDGDLDLVVVTYVEADPEDVVECRDKSGKPIHCQPERFPAQFDQLFCNNGDGTFTDVSREAGIEIPQGKGLGLAIADLDGDGRLDLFVANDGTANFLFRNRGGLHFEEVGLTAGVAYDGTGHPTASMGVVAEDLNGDGRIDLFHTNFINQANTLRWNLGGQFVDATLAANLAAPSRSRTGFGTVALDVDNDGTLDLFVANGHTDDQPWLNTPMAQTAQLFLGREHGRFAWAGPEVSPYFSRPVVGRGVAAGDLDNDGRVDLVVVHRDAPAAVLRNVSRSGHWLGLRLRGTRSARSPVGARVVCRAGGRSAVRWVTSGTSYLSASDPRLWFGLGSARSVEYLEVRWPSGRVQAWSNLPADQILDLQEGDNPVVPTGRSRVASPSRGSKDRR
jgi:tetratricopeptide (TPR) repeat protein